MTDLIPVPADQATQDLDPDFLTIGPYIRYEAVNDSGFARITMHGNQSLGRTLQLKDQGKLILPLDGSWETDYLDFTGDTPVVKPRTVIDWTFDRTTLPAGQEATIKNVPKGTVTFAGIIKGTQEHEGGDLSIGFGIPGDYTLTIEAFPYLPTTFVLTVTKGS